MAFDVTLSANVRSNLLTLQKTGDLTNRTNSRLSSGLRVASVVDDAVSYFQGKGLNDRANDLNERKSSIDQGISSLKTALGATESMEKVLQQLKGLVLSAKSSTDTAELANLESQAGNLVTQMDSLGGDASYQGLNLVSSSTSTLKVQFSEKTDSALSVTSQDLRATTILKASGSTAGSVLTGVAWSTAASSQFDKAVAQIDSAISAIRSASKGLGSNVALLQTRLDFTSNYVNTLTEGGGKLTLANMNEEGANLVSLQTRQQLGVQALSFAGQQEQGVLSLFR